MLVRFRSYILLVAPFIDNSKYNIRELDIYLPIAPGLHETEKQARNVAIVLWFVTTGQQKKTLALGRLAVAF